MRLTDAVDCIEDLIAVASSHGSAYVYKHNGGLERLENVLDCLKNSESVIRCRDCKYLDWSSEAEEHYCKHWDVDYYEEAFVKPDDFCSHAEKKE